MISKVKAAFRRGVADHLMTVHGFEYERLNSREWRMVDKMHTNGRSTAYASTVVRRVHIMRKGGEDGRQETH